MVMLQWQNWTPVVKAGGVTVTHDGAAFKAKYLQIGPSTHFWFYLPLTSSVAGVVSIEGQPSVLQDAHALTEKRHIGTAEYLDLGSWGRTFRLFASTGQPWNLYQYNAFAPLSLTTASGDVIKGSGVIHNSDSPVAL